MTNLQTACTFSPPQGNLIIREVIRFTDNLVSPVRCLLSTGVNVTSHSFPLGFLFWLFEESLSFLIAMMRLVLFPSDIICQFESPRFLRPVLSIKPLCSSRKISSTRFTTLSGSHKRRSKMLHCNPYPCYGLFHILYHCKTCFP